MCFSCARAVEGTFVRLGFTFRVSIRELYFFFFFFSDVKIKAQHCFLFALYREIHIASERERERERELGAKKEGFDLFCLCVARGASSLRVCALRVLVVWSKKSIGIHQPPGGWEFDSYTFRSFRLDRTARWLVYRGVVCLLRVSFFFSLFLF